MRMARGSRPRIVGQARKGQLHSTIARRGTNAAAQGVAVKLAEAREQFVAFAEAVIAAKVVLIGVVVLRHGGSVIIDEAGLIRRRIERGDFASDRIQTAFGDHIVRELAPIAAHDIRRVVDVDAAEIAPAPALAR